jgi:hypothetical protein
MDGIYQVRIAAWPPTARHALFTASRWRPAVPGNTVSLVASTCAMSS